MLKFYKGKQENMYCRILHQFMVGEASAMFAANTNPTTTIYEFLTKLSTFFGETAKIFEGVQYLETKYEKGGLGKQVDNSQRGSAPQKGSGTKANESSSIHALQTN